MMRNTNAKLPYDATNASATTETLLYYCRCWCSPLQYTSTYISIANVLFHASIAQRLRCFNRHSEMHSFMQVCNVCHAVVWSRLCRRCRSRRWHCCCFHCYFVRYAHFQLIYRYNNKYTIASKISTINIYSCMARSDWVFNVIGVCMDCLSLLYLKLLNDQRSNDKILSRYHLCRITHCPWKFQMLSQQKLLK